MKVHLGSNKSAMMGAVSTAWTLHKVELLEVEVDKLKMFAEEHLNEDDIASVLKSVIRNFEKVKDLHTTLTVLFSEIESAKYTKTTQDRITVELAALRKAQQTLKKSLDRKFKVVDTYSKAAQLKNNATEIDSDVDVSSIVQSIMDEVQDTSSPIPTDMEMSLVDYEISSDSD